jgi:polar amino acid transport system substrate-binding protein
MKYPMIKTVVKAGCLLAVLAGTGANAQGVDEKLRAMLPQRLRDAGVITGIANPRTPPYNFYGTDNTTLIGLEQDLFAAMGEKLGVKFSFSPAQSAQVAVLAVQAGRADVGGSIGGNVEREKIVDMVEYTAEATGIIVPAGNPNNVHRISDLCGLKAAATQGTIPLALLEKQKGVCPADKPLEVMPFPATDQVVTAVRSGRADAMMSTYGVNKYLLENQVETSGGRKLMLVPDARYAIGYQGFVTSKENTQLRDAIAAALGAVMADGTYKKVFDKWGMSVNILPEVRVNDAARFADYMKLD